MNQNLSTTVKQLTRSFREELRHLSFAAPVALIYNPLEYAERGYFKYLDLASTGKKNTVFLGMNPGPWGMAQTGVPFGEIQIAREWLKINETIKKPANEHPKRPILGFDCERSEVSGKRLWGYFKSRYETPERFFKSHFIANYCPLIFLEESGRNRTPDKLLKSEREQLFALCDKHLRDIIELLEPEILIGVGGFAERRLSHVFKDSPDLKIRKIMHPSPANPNANRGWAEIAHQQLKEILGEA